MDGLAPLSRPYVHTCADGSLRNLTTTKFAITNVTGTASGLCMIVQDVTEANRSKTGLAEKTAVMEAIMGAVPAVTSLRDTQGRIVFINQWAADRLGFDPAKLLGMSQQEAFGDNAGTQSFDVVAGRLLETGEAVSNFDFKSNTVPGNTFSMSLAPVIGDDEAITKFVTVAQDITALKHSEAALKENQRALAEKSNLQEAILEAVPATITLRDTQGRFTFINKWGAKVYDISQT